jgi:hypothetical protein
VGEGRAAGGTEGVGVVVVFKDEEVIEGRGSGAESGSAADEGKGGVLVRAEVEPVLAEILQEREKGLIGGEGDGEREGVDEEANGGRGARDRGVPAGAGGSENDAVLAGITSQEEGEGGLDEGVEGEAVGGGESAEGGS